MSIREIHLTNTLSGKKEKLQPQGEGRLSFYSCGPTVYGFIHIGNLRGGLVADMFFRYFKKVGYDVTYVRNYTDVDDKIIQRGIEENLPPEMIAKKYTHEVEKDFQTAQMLEPTHKTTVTTHIPEIIALIQRILDHQKAYIIAQDTSNLAKSPDGGEVFFSIDAFPTYGKLSHKKLEDLQAGARVEINEKKRNPLDFSLWKPAKPGEPFWDSPWGKGRPGWHIECSAMASRWLGEQIDIHHGGVDLIFTHHENEIAQSESAFQKAPFVKYWLHHAFVNMDEVKMSKSLGNILLARDFLEAYSGEFARALLLGVHYRSPIEFNEACIEQAIQCLQRIYEAKLKAIEILVSSKKVPDLRAEGVWGSFLAQCEATRKEIDEHLANDFNTPGALAALFTLIREFNRHSSDLRLFGAPAAWYGADEFIKVLEQEIGAVLGIGLKAPTFAIQEIKEIKLKHSQPEISEAEIKLKIQQRKEARENRDFAKADLIRQELLSRGIILKDSPSGTEWDFT